MASLIREGDIERHSAYFFIPHMLRYFDHPEVVAACMPPRPFMMVAPTQDEDMPREGVERFDSGCGSRSTRHWDTRSDSRSISRMATIAFSSEYFEWMVEWFRRFLTDETV